MSEINQLGLDLFLCPRRPGELLITVPGCASDWRRAQRKIPFPWEPLRHCRQCAIGAAHAGQPFVEIPHDGLDSVCCRCLRSGRRMVGGRWCVSCYNRTLEAAKGRNGKGKEPKKLRRLYRVRLGLVDAAVQPRIVDSVATVLEGVFSVLRGNRSLVGVGRCPMVHPVMQLSFFGSPKVVGIDRY